MENDPIFADVAGHDVLDVDATRAGRLTDPDREAAPETEQADHEGGGRD